MVAHQTSGEETRGRQVNQGPTVETMLPVVDNTVFFFFWGKRPIASLSAVAEGTVGQQHFAASTFNS